MTESSNTAEVRRILARRKQAVEAYLEAFFAVRLAADLPAESRQILQALQQFILAGGKRLRASLVATGYSCYADEPSDDRLVAAGAAVELLHAFLLAHDDVFDRDLTRHGVPTLHHSFASSLARRYPTAEAERYGASLAIVAGDVAATLAFEALAATPVEPGRLLPAIRTLARVGVETGYGEALDVLAELDPEPDEARVLQIHRYKTAKYTIEGPLHIGAILAGASGPQLEQLSAVAIPLGIAYQLQDDLLGVFGSEEVTGKPVGADLREGKQTLLTVHGLRGPYAEQLRPMLGDDTLDAAAVARAQHMLRDGGSVAYSQQRIVALVTEARAALARLEARPEAVAFLQGLIHLLLGRTA